MNEFIEKNRGLLRFCCIAARIIGWALLLLPFILVICVILTGVDTFRIFLSGLPPYFTHYRQWRPLPVADGQFDLLSLVVRFVLPGLLMLGPAQFIRYLSEKSYRPGWVLRCAEGILYLYAILLPVQAIYSYFSPTEPALLKGGFATGAATLSSLTILLTAAKVTILIGLGQILARVMPVIEESKTLV